MEIIYLLIPISLVFVGVILWAFLWAVGSGQFDDLEGPAHQILMDDDDIPPAVEAAIRDQEAVLDLWTIRLETDR